MPLQAQLELLAANLARLGLRRLVALGVAAAAVAALVGAIGYYGGRPETEPLYTGLSQADVARIGVVLSEAGIAYDVSSDGARILVRRAQAPTARMLLAERGLPAGGTSGYELFDKMGPLGLTSFMQDVTRARALEGELARTIQTVKGVTSARVHIVIPSQSSFRRSVEASSASIVLRTAGPPSERIGQTVRHLVAAAVPGLPAENVNVLAADGTVLSAGGDPALFASGRIIDLEQAIARKARENVRRTLAPYLGIENFEVSVTARINVDKRQVQEQIWDPENKAERSTRVVKELGSSQNANARQAATVEQNLPGEQSAQSGEQSKKSNQRREELTNFELGSKQQSSISEGHRIESLHVALVVNRKKLSGGEDAAVLDRKLKEIEAIATSAAGLDSKRGDRLSVAAVEFQEAPVGPGVQLSAVERMFMHLDTIIISITAIAALLILVWLGLLPSIRTIVLGQGEKAEQPQLERAAPDAPALSSPSGEMADLKTAQKPASLVATRADDLQTRLAELIERDERQVAEIMRQWLVKA